MPGTNGESATRADPWRAGSTVKIMRPAISHRELRNDNGAIMRRVEQGESFVITRNGVADRPAGRPTDSDASSPNCTAHSTIAILIAGRRTDGRVRANAGRRGVDQDRHRPSNGQSLGRPLATSIAPSIARTAARASADQAHPGLSSAKVMPAIAASTMAASRRSGPIRADSAGRPGRLELCSFLGIGRQYPVSSRARVQTPGSW